MLFTRFMKRLRAGQGRFTRRGEASVDPSFYTSDLFADLARSWWEESKGSSQPECWQAMLATWIETVPASAMDGVELRALADFASKYQEGLRNKALWAYNKAQEENEEDELKLDPYGRHT